MKKGDLILVEWDDHRGDDNWQNDEEQDVATMVTPCYFIRWTNRALKVALHLDEDGNYTGHNAWLRGDIVSVYELKRGKIVWERKE